MGGKDEKLEKDLTMSIPGGSIQYVTSGDGLMLECLLSGLNSPPLSLYWEKGTKVVSARERLGMSMETEKVAGVSKISLYIGSTSQSDKLSSRKLSSGREDTAMSSMLVLLTTLVMFS